MQPHEGDTPRTKAPPASGSGHSSAVVPVEALDVERALALLAPVEQFPEDVLLGAVEREEG